MRAQQGELKLLLLAALLAQERLHLLFIKDAELKQGQLPSRKAWV